MEQQTADPAAIRNFIVETFLFGDATGLDDDTAFMETGLIDSMGILRVVDFIERTYGVKLKEDQFIPENLDSIQCITGFLNRTIGTQNPNPTSRPKSPEPA